MTPLATFTGISALVLSLTGAFPGGDVVLRSANAGSGHWDKVRAEAFAAPVPSFDCKLAKTHSERAICADETLARLDDQLNLSYLKAYAATAVGSRVKLYTEELSWVRKRDLTCTMNDTFGLRRCLAETTIARIAELAGYAK